MIQTFSLIILSCLLHCQQNEGVSVASAVGERTSTESSQVEDHLASVATGADILFQSDFEKIDGLDVGLITNHTAKVGDSHLIDRLFEAENVQLKRLFAPEHGLREMADAGEYVDDGVDPISGVPIISLYTGDRRQPTVRSLMDLDLLLFDLQDVGARFYTYINTMGLAMQSAARAGIPFMVLDRPNILGGNLVDGYILDSKFQSNVGLYSIPIIHGLTPSQAQA